MTFAIGILALCMLLFGTLNTITIKIQDITEVGTSPKGKPLYFSHPGFQSACMFLGEFTCLLPYFCTYIKHKPRGPMTAPPSFRHSSWAHKLKVFAIFLLPACLDSGATTLLNAGLILTYASVFQMLRGTMVVFTGLLTVLLLKRRLHIHHWLGIILISAGAAIVGASSVLSVGHYVHRPAHADVPHRDYSRRLLMVEGMMSKVEAAGAASPLLGDLLIVGAQVLQATQFILEEKYLWQYRVPTLLAVGLEGFWGLVICSVALPVLSTVHGGNGLPLDSFSGALREISGSAALKWCTFGSIASIAFYNFFGLSVTKRLSGAGRATIDACRTAMVWMFSLWLGWEHFNGLQVVGFLVILAGSGLYNEVIRLCLPENAVEDEASLQAPLLPNGQDVGGEQSGLPPLHPSGHTTPRPTHARTPKPSQYSLVRSLRAGPTILSPRSLTSPASLADSATSPPLLEGLAAGDPPETGGGMEDMR